MKRSVTVEIAGQRFTLKTDADDEYVHALAAFVTQRLKDAKAGSRAFSTHALATLTALQIADDLFQAQKDLSALRDGVRRKARRIQALLDDAGREPGPR
jgi:cell division protein ZapA